MVSCRDGAPRGFRGPAAARLAADADPVSERSRLHALRRSGGEFLEVQRLQATHHRCTKGARRRAELQGGAREARPLPAWLQESRAPQAWQGGALPSEAARRLTDPAVSTLQRRVELDWLLDEEEEENLRPRSSDSDSDEVLEAAGDSDQDTAVPSSLSDKDLSFSKSWSLPSDRSPACRAARPSEDPPLEISWQTTAMLRNVPCRLLRDDVAELLNSAGMQGDYDFLYVPTNGKCAKSNLGYGFVNFRTPALLQRCYDAMHGCPLGDTRSSKLCRVTLAHVQGRENLLRQFEAAKSGARAAACGPLVV